MVLIQGTNALEETAYFLNLTVMSEKPMAIVGAQRPITAMSSDAALNLFDAIRVAASPESRGKGVVVATNGEINAAREVTKTNTYRVQTFRTRDMGLLGYVDADQVVYYRAPLRRHTAASEFDLRGVAQMPYVEVLYVHDGGHRGMARAASISARRVGDRGLGRRRFGQSRGRGLPNRGGAQCPGRAGLQRGRGASHRTQQLVQGWHGRRRHPLAP